MNCYGQTIYLYQRARFQNNYKSSINKQSSRLIKQPQYTRTLFSSSSIILVRTSILHLFYIGLSLILVFALFSLFRFIVSTSILHHLLFVRRKKRGESDRSSRHICESMSDRFASWLHVFNLQPLLTSLGLVQSFK